jgi:polysaccharide chain length determinant protein (PEP-CTERM system associated)
MQQDLSEVYFYLKGTLKYKRLAIVFALVVCSGAWAYIFMMPDKFESKAKVHIDSATVIRPLMRGMVIEPDISALIRIIQQLMFTRPNLEKIISLSQLSRSQENSGSTTELIEKLKKDITIAGGRGDIFDIAYTSQDPEVAKSVVQAVLTVFSEQTEGKALADASEAQRFIEQQIREYEIRLQDAEKAKEEFKRANIDLLNGSDQFQSLQKMKEQFLDANTALDQAISRRNVLAEQVAEIQESDEDWGLPTSTQEVSADNARIEALKDKRNEMLLKYTERHPEIIEIDKLIATIKNQDTEAKVGQADSSLVVAPGEGESIGAEKMANPYVQALKMGFDNAQAEVASSQTLVESIRNRISKLEEGLNERLTIETEMKNLNRDYETISGKYSELLDRREQAHITERVDDQTSRLKFKIADPPSKPNKPTSPNRKLFYFFALLAGVIFGFGVAFLVYFIRPVFMSARQVRIVTGLPSLGSVSLTSQGISQTNNIDWLLILTFAILLSGYVGIMIFEILK